MSETLPPLEDDLPPRRTPMHELAENKDLFPCDAAYNVAYGIVANHWDSPRLGGTSPSAVAAGATFLGLLLASDDVDIDEGAPAEETYSGIRKPQVSHDFDVTQADICDAYGITQTTVVGAHRILTRIVHDSVDEPHAYLKELKPIADRWAEDQDRRVV